MFIPNNAVADQSRLPKRVMAAALGITPQAFTGRYVTKQIVSPGEDKLFSPADLVLIFNYEAGKVPGTGFEEVVSAKDRAMINRDEAIAFKQDMDGQHSQVSLLKLRAALLPANLVENYLAGALTVLRSHLMRVPAILSLLIDGNEFEQKKFSDLADKEIRKVLNESATEIENIVGQIIYEQTAK